VVTLTLKLVRIVAHRVDNLPANFGVSRVVRSRIISQHLSDTSFATLTLEVTVLVADAGLRAPSVYQVSSS